MQFSPSSCYFFNLTIVDQILCVRLPDALYYAQPLRSDTKFHNHAELTAALQLIQNIQNAVVYKPDI
jgi:hypothetical protein